MKYSILDPTGNITALVESKTEISAQPSAAMTIMQKHPEVEQVGFVQFSDSEDDFIQTELRMAGGEFCGNASMAAAVLYYLYSDSHHQKNPEFVRLNVSGSETPVDVNLKPSKYNFFSAEIIVKKVHKFELLDLSFGDLEGSLPVIRLQGITHIIIDPESVFYCFLREKSSAEKAIKKWCSVLSADGLGFMFLEEHLSEWKLTPLVWIPGSGTVFWENSCASGSIAVGIYISEETKEPVSLDLHEPGGVLRVRCIPGKDTVRLSGTVKFMGSFDLQDKID